MPYETNALVQETVEQQMSDSDMIFRQIISGDVDNIKDAKDLICLIYIEDMSISRSGISHVIGRLERHFREISNA